MRASRLHGIRDLRLETLPRPEPSPGEVLLRVASVGVCGSDVHYYLEGRIGTQVVTGPIIMGHEFSAWVADLGSEVHGLEVGQLLCPHVIFCGTPPVDGVFAEYAVMPAENCFPLPDDFGPEAGAMLEPLGIAIHSVDLAHLKPGQTVAVLGAGPIGLLIAAVARAAGATGVYMTEPLSHRRAFALKYVADAALDPHDTDAADEGLVAQILRLTGGRGVDVTFEAAGAPETPQQAAEVTRIGGKVILVGISADDTISLNGSTVRRKGLTLKLVRPKEGPAALHGPSLS
jgi:L-iditol 2-dehydrogenase